MLTLWLTARTAAGCWGAGPGVVACEAAFRSVIAAAHAHTSPPRRRHDVGAAEIARSLQQPGVVAVAVPLAP